MKNWKFILFCFLSGVFLSSCTTAYKIAMGVKNPDFETQENLSRFFERHSLGDSTFFVFESLESYADFSTSGPLSVPGVLIFDKNGNFVPHEEENSCSTPGLFVSLIHDVSQLEVIDSINADMLLDKLVLADKQEKLSFDDLPPADLYLFLTWAKFTGKINKSQFKNWREGFQIGRENGLVIHEFLVNLDMQDSWSVSPETRKAIAKGKSFETAPD